MRASIDPFASAADTSTSIGNSSGELLELVGYEDYEDDGEFVGQCPIVNDLVQVGAVQFDYGTVAQMDAMQQQALSTVKGKTGHMSAGRKTITDINNHPATNAALSAAAAVAPYGTIVAGAVKLGLSAAQGILSLVDKFRKPPSQRIARVKARAAKKLKKIEAKLDAGKRTKRQRRRARRIERRVSRKVGKLEKMAADTRVKTALAPPVVDESTRSSLLDAAGKQLGTLMTEASKGDKKAQAGVVAIQFLGNKNLRTSADYLKAVSRGLPGKEAAALAKSAAALTDGDWKQIVDVAKKVSGNPSLGVDLKKVSRVANGAARVLAKRTNVAAKKRGKIKGLLVPADKAKVRNLNGSGAEQTTSGGERGILVLKTGKAVAGRWRA